jgi:hypothetical protein
MRGAGLPVSHDSPLIGAESRTDEMHFAHTRCLWSLSILSSCQQSSGRHLHLAYGCKILVLFLLATRLRTDLCRCIAGNRKILRCLILFNVESNDGMITYDNF